jgi:hypothetical protein
MWTKLLFKIIFITNAGLKSEKAPGFAFYRLGLRANIHVLNGLLPDRSLFVRKRHYDQIRYQGG